MVKLCLNLYKAAELSFKTVVPFFPSIYILFNIWCYCFFKDILGVPVVFDAIQEYFIIVLISISLMIFVVGHFFICLFAMSFSSVLIQKLKC